MTFCIITGLLEIGEQAVKTCHQLRALSDSRWMETCSPLRGLPLTSHIFPLNFQEVWSRQSVEKNGLSVSWSHGNSESPDKSLETRRNSPVLWVASGLSPCLLIAELLSSVHTGASPSLLPLRAPWSSLGPITGSFTLFLTTGARLAYSIRWWGALKTKSPEKDVQKPIMEVREGKRDKTWMSLNP